MKNLLALNWKMNKTPSEAVAWAEELGLGLKEGSAELAIMAPSVALCLLAKSLPAYVCVGGQDVSSKDSGAYTGEISAAMLKDAGAKYVVVGHSERREYHLESSAEVSAKASAAQKHGIVPIVCVGEKLDIRESGEHIEFTLEQLRESLDGVSSSVVIAYEPVWAIGTGRTATADDAEKMAYAIKLSLNKIYGEDSAAIRILYGGSVKPDNIAEICSKPSVGGALVGGASLKVSDVLGMSQALG